MQHQGPASRIIEQVHYPIHLLSVKIIVMSHKAPQIKHHRQPLD